ncbi:MAG: hypothetical protein NVS2B4_09040 [Ramlibacter sp.]
MSGVCLQGLHWGLHGWVAGVADHSGFRDPDDASYCEGPPSETHQRASEQAANATVGLLLSPKPVCAEAV